MKQIIGYKCDYCGKILQTKYAMKLHELRCFKNPISRSCITCSNLSLKNCLNGNPITDKEQDIIEFKVEGTHKIQEGSYECDFNVLNDEYSYLNAVETKNYCNATKRVLIKLKTNCEYHKTE